MIVGLVLLLAFFGAAILFAGAEAQRPEWQEFIAAERMQRLARELPTLILKITVDVSALSTAMAAAALVAAKYANQLDRLGDSFEVWNEANAMRFEGTEAHLAAIRDALDQLAHASEADPEGPASPAAAPRSTPEQGAP